MTNLIDSLPDAHRRVVDQVRHVLSERSKTWRVALVGGAVRDIFAERCPNDLDFVVQGCKSPVLTDSDDHALWVELAAAYGAERNGFGGCRTTIDSIQIDVWNVESNVLRPCVTIEELVGADGGCGGSTFDADCGAIDLADPDELIDGGLAHVMKSGVFELQRARGLGLPKTAIVLGRAAAIVHRYGWTIGPVLADFVRRHMKRDDALQRAEKYASDTGRAHLTAARIRELLCGA